MQRKLPAPSSVFDPMKILPRHIHDLVLESVPTDPKAKLISSKTLRLDKLHSHRSTVGNTDREVSFSTYPDSDAKNLKKAAAVHFETVEQNMVFGNGTSELIDLITRVFGTPFRDEVIVFEPTDTRFERAAKFAGLRVNKIKLTTNFDLATHKLPDDLNDKTKLIYLSNPNPIAGARLNEYNITNILDKFEGIVVLDESLIDYSEASTLIPYLDTYPNLIVLRSFSHAWGLAGARLGVAFAHPSVAYILNALRQEFNVSAVAQEVGMNTLEVDHQKERVVKETIRAKAKLKIELEQLFFIQEVFESETNALMVRVPNPDLATRYLQEEGIAVLDVSELEGCHGCIRITVGRSDQNELLMKALTEMPSKTSPTKRILRSLGRSFRKVGVFLGIFKKVLGA
ncbi:MAG: aminotransferase class I/II-fold pyridoxal phosphate-dependent enzyme [Saprospiraceae bacterium]|nr:aminotransferase class I/II-fold pyridoxal phosphate-dependent enzyme [Saprospiraceae bacterium]